MVALRYDHLAGRTPAVNNNKKRLSFSSHSLSVFSSLTQLLFFYEKENFQEVIHKLLHVLKNSNNTEINGVNVLIVLSFSEH